MREEKIVLLTLVLTGFTMSSIAAQTIQPLQDNVVDTNESETIVSSSPFDAVKNGSEVVVHPSLSFEAGEYNLTVQYSNHTEYYPVSLASYRDWNVTPRSIEKNLDVGSSGQIRNLTLSLKGNNYTDIQFELTGNASQYLTIQPETRVYPGIGKNLVLGYDIQRKVDFGLYTAELGLSGAGENQTVDLVFRFQDKINPVVEAVDVQDFEATQPLNFTVEVTDNLDVESVSAQLFHPVTVEVNNTTVVENQTIQELEFTKEENSNQWFATPPADTTGKFYLEGTVEDTAGNNESFSAAYTVESLDAVTVEESVEIPDHRVESDIVEQFGELEKNTRLQISLESFNQPLESGNETWQVGIQTESGNQFFDGEGSTLTISEKTEVELFVYGNSVEKFNGRLSLTGVEQHVEISDVTFSGEYLDCPVPEKQVYQVLDRNVTFTPVNSDRCSEAGWNTTYFVPTTAVAPGTDLRQNLRVVVPEQLIEQEEMFREQVLGQWKQKYRGADFFNKILLFVVVGQSLFMLALMYIYPYTYYIRLKDSERIYDRIRRAKRLGLKGDRK